MNYIPITKKDKEEMLNKIGVKNTDELLDLQVPHNLKAKQLNIADGLNEQELLKLFNNYADKNKANLICCRNLRPFYTVCC